MSDFFILLSFVAALCLNCSDIILYVRGVYQPWLDYFLTFYVAPEDELVVVYRVCAEVTHQLPRPRR